jgi:hypothetical protein
MRAGKEPSNPPLGGRVHARSRHRRRAGARAFRHCRPRAGVGLSDEAILEIGAECTFAGLVGTIDNLADRVELDALLAPRAWAR